MSSERAETEAEAPQRGRLMPVFAVLAFVVAYCLSTGPVVFLIAYFDLEASPINTVAEVVYFPLTALFHRHETGPVAQLFEKWIELWLSFTGRYSPP